MKKLALVGGVLVTGAGLAALLVANRTSEAADHLDGPAASANPMADINDVYTWMTSDGSKMNLAMTVSPGDDGSRHFGTSVQYVFHVTSIPSFGMAGTETKVICTFASDTSAQCWVGDKDYVKGDPSATAGITSTDGKVRVFAGHRSDPFFFNLQGFRDAVAFVDANAGGLPKDSHFCPDLSVATAGNDADNLRIMLGTTGVARTPAQAPCPAGQLDCFAGLNVMAIVLQVDKTLLNSGANTITSVWASTHTTP